MITMARQFGVNTDASGLHDMRDEVGTALGQASLTVEEQASTFATLANNGEYEAPHVIREIQQQLPGQALQTIQAKVASHQVLTPDENSDVDYALSFDDKPGGTAPNVGLDRRPGDSSPRPAPRTCPSRRSSSARSRSSAWRSACSPTSRAARPASPAARPPRTPKVPRHAGLQTLWGVGNLPGYGGEWPATIWHAYAQKMFGSMQIHEFPTPDFGGSPWNMLGPYTPKPKAPATPTPTPSSTCNGFYFAGHCFQGQGHRPEPDTRPRATRSRRPASPAPTPRPRSGRSSQLSGSRGLPQGTITGTR